MEGLIWGRKNLVNIEVDNALKSRVCRINGPHKKDKRPKLKVISSKKKCFDKKQEALRIESNVEENDSDVDSDCDVELSDGD